MSLKSTGCVKLQDKGRHAGNYHAVCLFFFFIRPRQHQAGLSLLRRVVNAVWKKMSKTEKTPPAAEREVEPLWRQEAPFTMTGGWEVFNKTGLQQKGRYSKDYELRQAAVRGTGKSYCGSSVTGDCRMEFANCNCSCVRMRSRTGNEGPRWTRNLVAVLRSRCRWSVSVVLEGSSYIRSVN